MSDAMREADVWSTLKPFHPSRTRLSGCTSASAAPSPPAASAPAPTITAGRSAAAKASLTGCGSLPSTFVLAEPLNFHAEVDFWPHAEHAAARARDLADAGRDQRRFPADVGADE